ncbi:MAG: HEPN domain-containing protein [Desulfovibrionales bacterium]|nr:MAG: HEPN domain-containing protein [Desulfovibrionales bacterium]
MTRDDHMQFWLREADKDFEVMVSLLNSGHYTWSLFIGHLVLEKLLKALFVANVDIEVPRIHHLLKIAKDAGLKLSVDQENFLLEVTTYNIKARYPDYKQRFARKATREFTQAKVVQIKEMRKWLKQQLPQA